MDQEQLPQDAPQEPPQPAEQPPSNVPEPVPAAEPYQGPPPDSVPAALPTSAMATVSLVAGILGFTFMPVLASIVALFTGYAARKETRAVPPRASGDGMATAGIIMGWIQVGLAVVGFCCVVAAFVLFGLIAAASNR